MISRPSGLGADGSGRKRSPGWGVVLSRDGQSANSVKSTRKYHRFHYGNGRRNIFLLAVFLNPRPPPELPPGLPAPRRRSWRRRGGHCVASATLPFYLGSWKRGPNNLESATIRFVSDLLRAAPPDHLAMGRGKENGRAEREGRRPAGGLRISLDRGQWSLGSRWTEGCITPIKNLPSR